VLQALNPLLLLSRNESHARVLAQYPPLFPALFSAIHAFHVAVDCRLLRGESNRTGTHTHACPHQQPAAGSSDALAGREGTDEADPGSFQEVGDAGPGQKHAHTTPEDVWQAQLAVAAATVVHHLAVVRSPSNFLGLHAHDCHCLPFLIVHVTCNMCACLMVFLGQRVGLDVRRSSMGMEKAEMRNRNGMHVVQEAGGCMSSESMSGVHIICLQHLALLNAQPWQSVLEVGLLLLSAARATIQAAAAFSCLNLCEHLLHVITDPSSPVQVLPVTS
jgi:hypothetical protein